MADTPQQVDIPNRALFKSAEVCELLQVQPYVLRSWEAEFKDLGVARSGSTARVYRREDVERVQRIKHLLLIEGLTLAGVRRKLEEEAEPPLDQELVRAPAARAGQSAINTAMRDRLVQVRQGLRGILELLTAHGPGDEGAAGEFALAPTPESSARGRASQSRERTGGDGTRSASPRRKRSA
jgi:DNA-binding transcriptional MerR regulator